MIAWSGRQAGEVSGYRLIPVPLEKPEVLRQRFLEASPDLVVHTAALAKVDDCRQNPWLAGQVNAKAPYLLAELAAKRCRFVHVSTDMVFRGDCAPYREADSRSPLSDYGRSKARAEEDLGRFPEACIARTSLLFGPSLGDPLSFFDQLLQTLHDSGPFAMFTDEFRTPLALPVAVRSTGSGGQRSHRSVESGRPGATLEIRIRPATRPASWPTERTDPANESARESSDRAAAGGPVAGFVEVSDGLSAVADAVAGGVVRSDGDRIRRSRSALSGASGTSQAMLNV